MREKILYLYILKTDLQNYILDAKAKPYISVFAIYFILSPREERKERDERDDFLFICLLNISSFF